MYWFSMPIPIESVILRKFFRQIKSSGQKQSVTIEMKGKFFIVILF